MAKLPRDVGLNVKYPFYGPFLISNIAMSYCFETSNSNPATVIVSISQLNNQFYHKI